MARIGIGITTRNRPKVLDVSLQHFVKYWPSNHEVSFVVVEDNSSEISRAQNQSKVLGLGTYIYAHSRLGIAKAKNECLHHLKKCDYVFLFDDDCFPQKDGWADLYIDAHKKSRAHHFIHLVDNVGLNKIRHTDVYEEYENCGGTLLFFTKEVVKKVGAYNPNFGIYGYEHAEYSRRVHQAGLQHGLGKYVTPVGTQEYIYSFDFDLNHLGRLPELGDLKKEEFASSLADEMDKVQGYVDQNSRVFGQNWAIKREL